MNWGGKRRGAGRKPKGASAGVSHDARERVTKHTPALVTLRVCEGLLSLRADAEHELLKAVRLETADEGFRVVHYSLLSNHLHLIVEAQDNAALSKSMKRFNVLLARRWNKLRRRKGRVFADRYHLHVLRTPGETRNALVYVLNNARKHGAWIAGRPDVYSSGEGFTGWREERSSWAPDKRRTYAESRTSKAPRAPRRKSCSALEADIASFEVSPEYKATMDAIGKFMARSWLLKEGWRRHGLIGVMERPAVRAAVQRRGARARQSADVRKP